MTDGAPVIAAEDATKRYGNVEVVRGLTLEVQRGEIIGLIGPSGAGKSTALRLLTGVEPPTSGRALLLGTDAHRLSPRERRQIGYVPQLSVLYPHLTIQENLAFSAAIYGLRRRRRADRITAALRFAELDEHRRKLLRDTSGGMQRRLALAAALVHEPTVLFLDEPTAGIDPVLRRKFWDHFGDLRTQGRTLFVTTQYVGEAAYCDRVGVLRAGRIVTVDTPEGLRRSAIGGEEVDLTVADPLSDRILRELADVEGVLAARPLEEEPSTVRVLVERADVAIPRLQSWLAARSLALTAVRTYEAPFDDVFVRLLTDEDARVDGEESAATAGADGG